MDAVYGWWREHRSAPPTPDRLDRLVKSALHLFEQRVCDQVLQRLSPPTRTTLEALLLPPGDDAEAPGPLPQPGVESILLHDLRADPGRATLDHLLREITRLEDGRALELPPALCAGVSPQVLATYRQRVAVEAPYELRRHPVPLRLTLLAAFCHLRSRARTDALADRLSELVHRMGAKAERKVEKAWLEELQRVSGQTGLLFRVAEAARTHPEGLVKDVVFPGVSAATLRDLVKEWQATGPVSRSPVQTVMRSSYRSPERRMLPRRLPTVELRSNNVTPRPLMRALAFLQKYVQSRMRTSPADEAVSLDGVVRGPWRDAVVETDPQGRPRMHRIT